MLAAAPYAISATITPTKIVAGIIVLVILILAYVYLSRRSRTS